jgi:hypothetical protein
LSVGGVANADCGTGRVASSNEGKITAESKLRVLSAVIAAESREGDGSGDHPMPQT